jgi:TolB protein
MKHTSLFFIAILFASSCHQSRNTDLKDSQSEYVIAYNIAIKDSTGKTNFEVVTMDPDGSNFRNITNNPDVAWTYRGHNQDLYFISDRDTTYRCFFLYKTDYLGNNIRKISSLRLEDSWMDTRKDGKEMIVSGRIGKDIRYQLFIINTETGKYEQLTNDTASMYTDPAISPDGKQIAFSYRKNKRDRTQNEEIYLMDSDGTNLKQLTFYPQDNISKNSGGIKAGAPHWHPTENFISYISMQDGKHSLFAITPDGNKQWKLTDNTFSEAYHDWSPDGKLLAFDMTDENEKQYHIMLMNWKTKETKQLTDTTYRSQLSPVFILKGN